MNSKQFLLIGGVVLVLVGILGFLGVIGPTSDKSIFGATWWFDNAENWAHTVLGVVALILGFVTQGSVQRPITILVGVLALAVGVYNFFSDGLLGANLENPADLVLHLVVGVWALFAGFYNGGKKMDASAMSSAM